MGVMTDKDYEVAVLNNLKDWEWDINSQYPLEKKEAEAIIRVMEMHKAQQMMKELRGL